MNLEQALLFINDRLYSHSERYLSDVETLVIRGAWDKQTYEAIAQTSNYSTSYLVLSCDEAASGIGAAKAERSFDSIPWPEHVVRAEFPAQTVGDQAR